jgi:hypothetical protein
MERWQQVSLKDSFRGYPEGVEMKRIFRDL